MKNLRFLFLTSLIVQCNLILYSQNFGTWNVLQLKHKFHNDWVINGETQLRSLSFYSQFHYYEFNGSILKQFTKECGISLGAGNFNTFSPGGNFHAPQVAKEIRITTLVLLNQHVGKLEIENRYKVEFRKFPSAFKYRVRYRLGLAYPIQRDGKLKVVLANELFTSISKVTAANQSIFEKNRISSGLQLKLRQNIQITIGYLEQYDTRYYDETGKRFFQLTTTIIL